MSRKKRILFNSNHCKMFTGFGKNAKNVLTYLQKTGKYEILEYAAQMQDGNPQLGLLPWKARGAIPNDPQKIQLLNQDPNRARLASYGEMLIEEVVEDFRPDLCFFVEDAWGVSFNTTKKFWGKIPSVLWVTQDSLPLIHKDDAGKTPYYWTWADFARKEFHRLGFKNVVNQYPLVDLSNFYNLGAEKKKEIRKKFNIGDDVFIIGDVFRNQLRKLIATNGMEGYSIFKKENPGVKSILLLITNFSEGWNIPELAKQYGVPLEDIWTAYVSSECDEYVIHPFVGQEQKCPFSGKEKALNTVSVGKGVTEEQLNEIYNIMDVFLHPATSGACELPCVEAAAAEKIILTADYSYGEDIIELNGGALCLDWSKYTEIGTQFIKSSPYPSSIAKQLKKVLQMDFSKRNEMGKRSREWANNNYSIEKNGKKIEQFIDGLPNVNWDEVSFKPKEKNPNFQLPLNWESMSKEDFVRMLYREILAMEVTDNDSGFLNWINQLNNGGSRSHVYQFFVKTALDENKKNKQVEFSSLIDKNTNKNRILFVIKESIGDVILCTALFQSLHKQYPNSDLYVATSPQYFEILEGNQYIYKLLAYQPFMEQEMLLIGAGNKEDDALFHHYFHPAIQTQRQLNYLSHDNSLNCKS